MPGTNVSIESPSLKGQLVTASRLGGSFIHLWIEDVNKVARPPSTAVLDTIPARCKQ